MELKVPEFLATMPATPDAFDTSELRELELLVDAFKERTKQVEELEQKLKQANDALRMLGQEAIPAIMNSHGFADLRLRDGTKVVVKEELSVAVPEQKKASFFKFLADRKEDDIIKLTLQFKRMPAEKLKLLFDFLHCEDYDMTAENAVHPATLKKYFKDLLGVGDENQAQGIAKGKYLRTTDILEVATVFTYFTTKLK